MSDSYHFYPFVRELNITHLVSLFYFKSPRNFCFEGESHHFWELIYIDKGKMLITAGDKQYLLKAGELAFHKPDEFHAVHAYEQTPSNFIIAAFVCDVPSMRYFEHRLMSLTSKEREYLYEAVRCWKRETVMMQTPRSVSQPIKYWENIPFAQSQLVQQYLELLLIHLVQRNEGVKIQHRVETYAMQTLYRQLADHVVEYLESHITESVTLGRIAGELGYSVPQMKKLFHAQMHCGIIAYFIDMKMSEAKRLMQEGNMNISQIAEYLGYADPSYFSRLFKSCNGMTPTEYCCSFGDI